MYTGTLAALEGHAGLDFALTNPKAHATVALCRLSTTWRVDLANEGRDHFNRAQRRDLRIGRALWARLGAWPWSLFGPDGRPWSRWWEDAWVSICWRKWKTGGFDAEARRLLVKPSREGGHAHR